MHVDSVSARFAQVASQSVEQSGDRHRSDCVGAEDDGAEFELRRSGAAHPQLGSDLGGVQRSESRLVHHGHAQAGNDCW